MTPILALVALAGPPAAGVAPAPTSEMRGLWVVRTAMVSPEAVDTVVDQAKSAGFNALFGQAPGVAGMTLSLGNSGDELRLIDKMNVELDKVQWERSAAGWNIASPTGSSIKRTNPDVDTDTVADWQVQTPAMPSN